MIKTTTFENTIPENIGTFFDLLNDREFIIELSPSSPTQTLNIIKNNGTLSVINKDNTTILQINDHNFKHNLLVFSEQEGTLKTTAANIVPIYWRCNHDKIRMSNTAHNLIISGENLRLSSFVVLQYVKHHNYPIDNLFIDIHKCHCSSFYKLTKQGFEFDRSTFSFDTNSNKEMCFDNILNRFEEICSSANPLVVPLSGGYDSRLNLIFAYHFSKIFHNKIFALNMGEIGNKDTDIAIEIVNKLGIDLEIVNIDAESFAEYNSRTMQNKQWLLYNSGLFRTVIIQYFYLFSYIKSKIPDCVIIGMGAEAHKGKYYNLTKDLRVDAIPNFGIREELLTEIAKDINIDYRPGRQNKFINDLIDMSRQYKELTSQIDFLHYHTYVSNGYGRRCQFFSDIFHIPFPFLNDELLSNIFLLKKEEKEAFLITRELIQEYGKDLMSIEFISGNEPSIKNYGYKNYIRKNYKWLYNQLIEIKKYIDNRNPQGPNTEGMIPFEIWSKIEKKPESEITKKLLLYLEKSPSIRLSAIQQVILYLMTIEKEYQVNLVCDAEN